MNELTLATGIATETFNYTADQAVSLRVRKGDDLVGFDQIWQFEDPSTFVDETTDANDVGGNDWDIFPAAEGVGDICYFGYGTPFDNIVLLNATGTAGVGSGLTVVFEYWNGATWAAVPSLSDGSSSFTSTDVLQVITSLLVSSLSLREALTDWATTAVNGSTQYWIRARITAGSYSTNPVYDQGFISIYL